ncbi:1,5-anhydro-D-fructose reductase (plasmid) [Aquisphaera giovannonii]|uniref:1,5-anhydro-D-fructose reductase n=1 Tax=Aquisphaera giovannonii TaxID=406548 RepID=A0A5B9WH02_9BACT|nr:NAD-dependent epimerase/dehydratase family protein [Aquisphaera giovannonii]QEH39221.1 1,5-anhydro-D-fructose reductase [Aquisphaera giovannonii]
MGRKSDAPPFRVGLVGTGYIADWHAKALGAARGASLVAACDLDLARAEAFGRRHGARAYGSLEAMIGDEANPLDAVHVLLPPDRHAAAASAAIRAGKHVFLEKPMAVDAEECSGLIGEAAARGVAIGVNHNFLFAPNYEQFRGDVRSGRLGRLDRLTVTWHRGLDQLLSGPPDIWMLRDPRNIMLEIGPHCLAPVLDLLGPLEVIGVHASNRMTLEGGRPFYRRWSVEGEAGGVAVSLHLSFAQGFTEQTIHARGSVAAGTVDYERDTYLLHRHSPYSLDFDRYRMIREDAGAMAAQARRTLAGSVLSKLKLSSRGNPYGLSIARAVQAFYAGMGGAVDPRLSAELGRDLIAACAAIGREGAGEPAAAAGGEPEPVATPREAGGEGAAAATPAEVLVLGATGFIGRELARQLLASGRRIRLLVRSPGKLPADLRGPGVEVVRGDLTRAEDLGRALGGIKAVYHLARANVKTWEEYTEQEIEATRRVAEACLARGVGRLIYTGTIDSYYAGGKAGTITEDTPLDPQIAWRNLYARAKAASEGLLMDLHRDRGLPVVIFRPGIVIGRGSSPLHWGVGMWSWNSVCQVWGRGDNPLPLVLVEDVASALVAALEVPGIEGESFNLVADTDLTASDYLAALEEHAGASFQKLPTAPWRFYAADVAKWAVKQMVRHPDRRRPSYRDWESRTQRARFDCTKARNLLNWRPVCDREEIIRRGIQQPASQFLS